MVVLLEFVEIIWSLCNSYVFIRVITRNNPRMIHLKHAL